MKEAFLQQHKSVIDEYTLTQKIQLQQASNLDDYYKVFLNLSTRIQHDQTKLIVIDNILAVCDNFIKADGQVDFIERSNFLLKHTKQLKRLSYDHNLVVVVLNNVVADMSGQQAKNGFFGNKSSNVVPSLGLMWSNCINERLGLRQKRGHGSTDVKRTMSVEKSSFMRRSDLDFEINQQGIRGKH